MHTPYEQRLKHKADFKVKYRFYSNDEGGRTITPYQGYRSDFWYPHEGGNEHGIFMIWPEFEDDKGNIILESDKPVEENGTARMWIIIPERRKYHKTKITNGIKGFFMEGSRKVAECEIIEIIGLLENPIQ